MVNSNTLQESFTCLIHSLKNNLQHLAAVVIAFLAPIHGLMLTVGLFIVVDTIMGIWKAKKLKETISSRNLSRIISKMFLYQSTILMFFILDYFILNQIILVFFSVPLILTKIVAAVLASVEIFSIDENWRAVKGNGLWFYFKQATSRAKDIKNEIDPLK